MIFNGLAYYFFFLVPAAALFRAVSPAVRPWVCAAFGISFFVYFSVTQFGGWAGAACVLILFWEATFRRFYRERALACVAGVAITLGVLGVFKYWNFATGLAFSWSESNPLRWSGAFLPLGISFFTFEFIHYAVDRYRGRVERGSLGEYLAFIFFFPTMVAGPIKRFQGFVISLRHPSDDVAGDWAVGTTRILAGLVKKFAIADVLTSVTVHLNRSDILQAGRGTLLFWVFAYGWKIYFDFSAYSDIAIGSSRLFGISIPENFDWPYARRNITEFWRHWHMSLYAWLVDYVFIPLGGSRGSTAFVCRNIMIVMVVSGIWHGAGLNFAMWGVWHGTLLVAHRLWTRYRQRAGGAPSDSSLGRAAAWFLTYATVNLGWAFFAMDLDTALVFFRRLVAG